MDHNPGQIVHASTNQCMTLKEGSEADVYLADCDTENQQQLWTFSDRKPLRD